MVEKVHLTGPYVVERPDFFEKRAARISDPRHVFYKAMLKHRTYDAYLAEVGRVLVEVEGYKQNPISGRAEILYCRRNARLSDA